MLVAGIPKTEKSEERISGEGGSIAPGVSVVIPAYNAAEFIAATLDSVFSQTFTDYEVIVVNDGSPDTEELEKALAPYYERLIYIKQENGGTAAARNTAIRRASGEWLAFLDGDDIWLPEYLESQLSTLAVKKYDLIYADAEFFGDVRDRHKTFMQKSPSNGEVTPENLLAADCHIITSGTIVRRQEVLDAGLFDEDLPRIGMEDFDLWFRLAKAKLRIGYQRRVLLKYRVRSNSLSGSNVRRAEREITALEIIRKKYDLNELENAASDRHFQMAIAELDVEKGKHNLTRENFSEALENFRQANKYHKKLKYWTLQLLLMFNPKLVLNLFKIIRPKEFRFISPGGIGMREMTEKTPVKLSLLKQSAWLMSAKTIGFALSFILPLLTVRYLTQDKVGIYRQAFQIVTNAVSILPLGFSMSAYYFLNRQPENRAYTITNILLFNFITGGAACLTFFFYPQLLGNLFHSDELTRLAPKIGVVIWLWIFSAFLEIAALANQEAKIATAFIILAQFTKTLLMASAVVWFSTVEAFIYAAMIQAALQICALLYYLNSRFPRFWTKFDFTFFREQIIYALPFGLAALLYNIQTDIHNYFVGYRFSNADYAIYAYGCFQLPLIAMLYESFSAVMIPRMSELQSEGKTREMLLMSVAAMRKLALAYFPLFAFLMVVADTFITTMFTKNFAASVPIFRINLILLPFYCLMIDPVGRAFPEIGRYLLKIRIILFICLFAALWFGIQNFDMRGVITIVVVAVLFEQTVSLAKVLSILKVRKSDFKLLEPIGKTALASAIAGAVLFLFYTLTEDFLLTIFVRFSHRFFAFIHFEKAADFFGGSMFLGICFLIFLSVYFASANWFGAINSEEKESIREFVYKRFPFFGNYFIQNPKSEIQN